MVDQDQLVRLSNAATARVMSAAGTTKGSRAGFLMISTILVEAWDLYAIGFVLVFVKADFNPTPLELGMTTAAAHLGGLLGALLGGWLSDRLGRRTVFISTMVAFIVLGLLQGAVQDMWQLMAVRFLLGFPLGSDISTGFSYIMESMPKGKREVMGTRWQSMFAIGQVTSVAVVTALFLTGMDHSILWRVGLMLGALPALVLLIGRLDVPDTALALIQRGKFREAKKVSAEMFGDDLPMLPNQDVEIKRAKTSDFLRDIMRDPFRKRATLFSWISNLAQALQSGAFSFYLPTIVLLVGVSESLALSNLVLLGVYAIASIGAFTVPKFLPRFKHRGVSQIGFAMTGMFLILCGISIALHWTYLLPVFAIGAQGFHYWAGSNGVTVGSMVAAPRYRATASGFAYMWTKIGNFIALLLFPILLATLGTALATASIAVASLIGFLGGRYVLKEVYGAIETTEIDALDTATLRAIDAENV